MLIDLGDDPGRFQGSADIRQCSAHGLAFPFLYPGREKPGSGHIQAVKDLSQIVHNRDQSVPAALTPNEELAGAGVNGVFMILSLKRYADFVSPSHITFPFCPLMGGY